MNLQEYRNLQEAYLNVYQELDEVRGGGKIDAVSDIPSIGERGSRSAKDAGMLMSPLDRATARVNALKKRGTPEATKRANRINSRFVNPTKSAISRSILAANNAASAEKRRLMNPQESYDPDLFDVILEYLIIEGYADTNENALVIMANMSEDWRESIVEGYKPLPVGKMIRQTGTKAFKHGMKIGKNPLAPDDGDNTSTQTGTMSAIAQLHDPEKAKAKSKYKGIVEAGRLHTSSDQQVGFARIKDQESGGRGKKPMSDAEIKKQKGGQEFLDRIAASAEKRRLMNPQESYNPDLFDVILEYLISEGYADTNENALVIMANMSEDWRESILSESLSIDRRIRFREIDKKNRGEGKPRAADGDTRNQKFDTTSFGKGNKATRRQGYNVTDTSTWPDQEGRRSEHDANRGVKRKKSGNVNYQQQPK